MRKRKSYLLIGRVVLLILPFSVPGGGFIPNGFAAPHAASYTFISVGVPNPRGELTFTSLSDINDKGEIVGGFTVGEPQGFLIDKNGRTISIQCPGASFTAPRGINKFGEIAGGCYDGTNHAFFRDRRGTYTLIDFPDATLTEGININDRSQILGTYRDENGVFHEFLWDNGKFSTIDIPSLPDNVINSPNSINKFGQIVGFYFDADCGCNEQGYLDNNGTLTLINFPGAEATLPFDINNQGEIVGVYIDSNLAHHGFLLDRDGNFTTIDVPFVGIDFTEAHGINDHKQIVGR